MSIGQLHCILARLCKGFLQSSQWSLAGYEGGRAGSLKILLVRHRTEDINFPGEETRLFYATLPL